MDVYMVTGGAGFIGSNFIKLLHEKKPDSMVINIDKLTYAGNLKNLEAVDEDMTYEFVQADISDKEVIEEVFRKFKPDYVVNFAAESHVDRSICDSTAFVKTNIFGTQVLLDACKRYGVKKFLQVSTDEVYGSTKPKEPATEAAPLKPGNPYAASKAAGDLLVQAYFNTYGLPVLTTRSSNNFGPCQHREKLIPMVIEHCVRRDRIPVYGDGLNTRDWIYVRDNCIGIYSVLDKGVPGEIYNISADNAVENLTLIRLIIEIIRSILPDEVSCKQRINEGLIEFVKDRKGHDRSYSMNTRKIIDNLGWRPEAEFRQSLENTIRWYIDNIFI